LIPHHKNVSMPFAGPVTLTACAPKSQAQSRQTTTPLPANSPQQSPSRRRLLHTGAIGMAGTQIPGLLNLPQLLAADQQTGKSPKSCIFVFQYGGLSQLDSWDPKPNAPSDLRGPFKPIATATPGFQVGELMPNLAAISNKYCVIRSMSHRVPVHNVANEMLLAGSSTPRKDSPSLGSIITRLQPAHETMPSYVWLQKFGGGAAPAESAWLSGGFLGTSCSPLLIGERHSDNPANPGFRPTPFASDPDLTTSRLEARRLLLQNTTSDASSTAPDPAGARLQQLQNRAFTLLQSNAAASAFHVDAEPDQVRDRYGRHPFGQNLLLARRLIEAGVRLVSVVAWMGLAPNDRFVSVETWDMHGNAGISIFDNGWNGLGWALPRADAAMATLLEDLDERGLLDSTLVVMAGEFGRTPRISRGASAIGRDHWPNCYSAMLAGAGIPGGTVYGASDETAAYVRDRPVSPEDFGATILAAMGIDPRTRLSPDGFTLPASEGQPIFSL
jgi:hypothetical protein